MGAPQQVPDSTVFKCLKLTQEQLEYINSLPVKSCIYEYVYVYVYMHILNMTIMGTNVRHFEYEPVFGTYIYIWPDICIYARGKIYVHEC